MERFSFTKLPECILVVLTLMLSSCYKKEQFFNGKWRINKPNELPTLILDFSKEDVGELIYLDSNGQCSSTIKWRAEKPKFSSEDAIANVHLFKSEDCIGNTDTLTKQQMFEILGLKIGENFITLIRMDEDRMGAEKIVLYRIKEEDK